MDALNRKFFLVEKIIGVVMLLYGCTYIFTTFYTACILTQFVIDNHIASGDYLFFKIFKPYFLETLISSITIIGSILLLFKKRIGWLLSVIASLLEGLYLFIGIIKASSLDNPNAYLTPIRIFLAALFFSFLIFLLSRPVREKYNIYFKVKSFRQ